MADDNLEVDIEFDVKDKASPKISRLEKNVTKLGGAVDRASSNFMGMIKQSAMMAGFFALGPAIAGAKNYISHLDKISNLTGMTAQEAAGYSNALEGAGVSAQGVENVMSRLVKKGAQAAEGNKTLAKMAKQYGITIKDGPQEALYGVAALLEKGKINAGGLQRVLGVGSEDAAALVEALSVGPDELAKSVDAAMAANSAFSETAMEGMQRWENASSRVGIAFKRMTAGVLIKFAPALEKLAVKFEGSIDGWTVKAEKFANFLVKHMDKIIAMAKTYAKIMLVNTVAQKLTGVGLGGIASKGIGMVRSKMMQPGITGVGSAISSIIGPFLKGFTSFRPIITGLLRLAPIGGVIMLVVMAVKALGENFNGITTRLKKTFGGIFDTIGRIGAKIAAMFSGDSPIGKFFGAVGYAFLEVVNKIGEAVGFILLLVEKIIGLIPDILGGTSPLDLANRVKEADAAEKYARKVWKAGGPVSAAQFEANLKKQRASIMKGTFGATPSQAVAPAAAAAKLKAKEEPTINQDFRGSRFDIKQAFAEGYDPDRIATAFSNELGSLGEKKLQSGFTPLFTVR